VSCEEKGGLMKRAVTWLVVITLAFTTAFIGMACVAPTQATAATVITETAPTGTTPATTAVETSSGATTASAAEKKPADFEIVYIVKASGIPWFDISSKGLTQCARDYGFNATIAGPPKDDAAIQAQMVQDYIAKGVEAIAVCPKDPATIEPVFEKANKAGILTFGNEGTSLKNVSFDIEAVSYQNFGESIMKAGLKYTGSKGEYITSVGFLTSVSHNEWVDAEIAYQQANAPDFKNALGYNKGSDRFEDQEDQKTAHNKILELLKTYPNLKLVIGSSLTTGIAAGMVIEEKGLKGKLIFVGTGYPATIGKYLKNGTVQEGFFWDPYMVGYALGYIALNTWLGKPPKNGDPILKPDGTSQPGYEAMSIIVNKSGSNVIFGTGQISITKDNVDEWYKKFADYGWKQD
jgi:simple sugar transport system substrate-binding protein